MIIISLLYVVNNVMRHLLILKIENLLFDINIQFDIHIQVDINIKTDNCEREKPSVFVFYGKGK